MMASPKSIFFVLLICSYNSVRTTASDDIAALVAKFSDKIYPSLPTVEDNIVSSPFSLHSILSLLYQGSGGDTAKNFEKVLGFPDTQTIAQAYRKLLLALKSVTNVTLNTGSNVLFQKTYTLTKEFRWVATNQFLSEVEPVDFVVNADVAQLLNNWVANKTNNTIKFFANAGDFDDKTQVVLANAVYFLGNWKHQFEETKTRDTKFLSSDNETVPCRIMNMIGTFKYKSDVYLDAEIVSLPYKNEKLSLTIILPGDKDGIAELEEKLQKLGLIAALQDLNDTELELFLPRFKIEQEFDLKAPLTEIGLGKIYEASANFSNIAEEHPELKITEIVQKLLIEVNERGTEAPAASGNPNDIDTEHRNILTVNANHPFIYTITYNDDGAILPLIVGKLTKPQ